MARTRFTVKEGIAVSDDNSAGGYPLVPVGSLIAYAGSTAPEGWLLCDGAAISRTTYANLWALINTTYGSGNGTSTFNVPDLRSRMPVGAGAGVGLTTRALAGTGGAESVVIASGNLPTHVHSIEHNHASVDSGDNNVDHVHSIDPPNTTSTGANVDHSHDVNPPSTDSGGHSVNHSHTTGGVDTFHEHQLYYVVDAASGTAKARVSASGATLSNTGITNFSGQHAHGTGGVSADHSHATDIGNLTTTGHSVNHDHNTNISAFNSAGASAAHKHGVDLPNFIGDSGNGGFLNTALGLMNPFLAVNYIIKY